MLSWHALIIFRVFITETKLDFVSFNDKHLQRRRKFVAERDFPILNPDTGQVLCLSRSRDQKFVTSLVESAIPCALAHHDASLCKTYKSILLTTIEKEINVVEH